MLGPRVGIPTVCCGWCCNIRSFIRHGVMSSWGIVKEACRHRASMIGAVEASAAPEQRQRESVGPTT